MCSRASRRVAESFSFWETAWASWPLVSSSRSSSVRTRLGASWRRRRRTTTSSSRPLIVSWSSSTCASYSASRRSCSDAMTDHLLGRFGPYSCVQVLRSAHPIPFATIESPHWICHCMAVINCAGRRLALDGSLLDLTAATRAREVRTRDEGLDRPGSLHRRRTLRGDRARRVHPARRRPRLRQGRRQGLLRPGRRRGPGQRPRRACTTPSSSPPRSAPASASSSRSTELRRPRPLERRSRQRRSAQPTRHRPVSTRRRRRPCRAPARTSSSVSA